MARGYYDFQLSKAQKKFGHKVLTTKLQCCLGQLAPFPRETARIDRATSYNKGICAVSLGNGASCP